ncbi:YadA-like family protein [uncultured Veillonella sp.]|uniref:YadA-like family protein n=1 Tax=uncultured Veillonella sp. TaxID=159268 RepID=UPI0028EB8D8C|nr:YadA-like family protein [uncultured Veillonella sp.]
MNKMLLLLAGVVSVLSMNGLTVHADSTVSTNSENLLVNTSTNADGSTNYEISTTNYPIYQGTFIGTAGDINHGIRIESDGISISSTVGADAGHPDDRHAHIGAGHFDMYNGTHELVWVEDYGLAILDRKENKYMAQMEPKTFTMTNIQSGDKSELSTDGTKIVHYDNENSTEYNTNYGYNGVTITTTDGDHDNEKTVSLTNKGLDNGNNKIVNVSKGEVSKTSTEVINGSQLHEVKTQVDNNTNRISTLENNTVNIGDKVLNNAKSYTDRQVSKVGAGSAALAGLHYLDYNPNDKWSFATSLGHYKHSTASAIGASYQPNENSMVHAGVTLGGESMFNIGASFKVGEQDPTLKTSRFEMAKQIKELQADNASLRADNEELRAEVNEIKAILQKLQ